MPLHQQILLAETGQSGPSPGDPFNNTIDIPGLLSARFEDASPVYTFSNNVKIAVAGSIEGSIITGVTCDYDVPEAGAFVWFTIFNPLGNIDDNILVGADTGASDAGIFRIIQVNGGTVVSSRISGGFIHFLPADQITFDQQAAHSGLPTTLAGAHLHLTGFYE